MHQETIASPIYERSTFWGTELVLRTFPLLFFPFFPRHRPSPPLIDGIFPGNQTRSTCSPPVITFVTVIPLVTSFVARYRHNGPMSFPCLSIENPYRCPRWPSGWLRIKNRPLCHFRLRDEQRASLLPRDRTTSWWPLENVYILQVEVAV